MDAPHLVATSVTYYHLNDELLFLEWLGRIPCVAGTKGIGADLFILLSGPPTDDGLRQLLALFYRYKVDMRQLARFESDANRDWFKDKRKYWHRQVFGGAPRPKAQGGPRLAARKAAKPSR